MAAARSLSKLVHEWPSNSKRYRLVEIATHTAGYRDKLIVEKCETDHLGGEKWVEQYAWYKNGVGGTDAIELFADAIDELKNKLAFSDKGAKADSDLIVKLSGELDDFRRKSKGLLARLPDHES